MVRSDSPCYPYYDLSNTRIVGFQYITPLTLQRSVEALKARSGVDAEYVVAEPYSVAFQIARDKSWHQITVPKGLLTDLASVPAVARSVIDRVGPHLEASIVHDYLYVAWQDIPSRGPRSEDRNFADRVFLAGMIAAGVSAMKRQIIYRAVRTFGWSAYSSPNTARYSKTR